MLLFQFYADIFEFADRQERALHSATKHEWIDWWFTACGFVQVFGEAEEGQFENVTQCLERMCCDLNFGDSWFRVVASFTSKEPHPKSRIKFQPISCLATSRKLLRYLWIQKLPPITWKMLQTASIPNRQGAQAVFMIERGIELAREWSLPVYKSQVDLKKSVSDRISHNQVAMMLQECLFAACCCPV